MIAVSLGIFLADQLSKRLVMSTMSLGESRPVLGEAMRLTYIMNPHGLMGFSFGPAGRYLMLPLSLAAVAAIIYFYTRWQRQGPLSAATLGMLLAGAAGNMLDRVRLGAVVDFIDCDIPDIRIPAFDLGPVHYPGFLLDRWYTFNLADSSVLIGVIVLFILTLHGEQPRKPEGIG
jgi:signal peptidase II